MDTYGLCAVPYLFYTRTGLVDNNLKLSILFHNTQVNLVAYFTVATYAVDRK